MLIKLLMSKFSPLRIFPILREIKSKEGVLHFRRRKIFSWGDRFLCLHEFYESEKDLYEHDHPRDFWCVTLIGGYYELHKGELSLVPPFKPRSLKAEFHHRIHSLKNGKYSLSVSLSGPQKRDWGYVKPDGSWISRESYQEEKRELKEVNTQSRNINWIRSVGTEDPIGVEISGVGDSPGQVKWFDRDTYNKERGFYEL